ncbi:MAG: hypothetical protein ACRDYC_13100 [Acidimicrobiales bacterium]
MTSSLAVALAAAAGIPAGPLLSRAVDRFSRHAPAEQAALVGAQGAQGAPAAGPCPPCCRRPLPWRGAILGMLAAGAAGGVTAVRGVSWELPGELVLTLGLLALAFCDLEHYLLPRAILYPVLLAVSASWVLAAAGTGDWGRLGTSATCGAIAFVAFAAIAVAAPKMLAFGDARLAGLIGMGLGFEAAKSLIAWLLIANVAAALVGVALLATGRGRLSTPLPYGVFLVLGAIAVLLIGA